MKTLKHISILLYLTLFPALATAQFEYQPARVVYDVSSADPADLNGLLDRVGLLQKIYRDDPFDASIVLVIHEGAIPLFAKTGSADSRLSKRARSMALGEIIRFRLCLASARMQGFGENDFHDFIVMVPMADAEIVRLQHAGYAYMH